MIKKYDCIIAGAGLAGFAAAVGASKAGAKVLLFDRMPGVGGTAVYTITPVLSGWSNKCICNNAGLLLADKLKQYNAFDWRGTKIVTDEDSLQRAMTDVLQEHNVDILCGATLCRVERKHDRICSVKLMTSGGLLEFSADNFVDATGDAALSLLAGAETIVPAEDESMTKTLMFKVRNVRNFDKEEVVKLFNEHVSEFPVKIQNAFMGLPLIDKDEVLLNLTAVTGNAADPAELSRMYNELTLQIAPVMEFLKKHIPCFANAVVSKIAPVTGVRYTRSVRGLRTLTMLDIHNPQMPPEPVAFCGNYIGGHYIKHFSSPWGNEINGNPAVPYGAIRAKGVSNLLTAGRIIDVEPQIISAVRLAAECLATGQAAGIAAALGVPDYQTLYAELDRQECLEWLKEMKEKNN